MKISYWLNVNILGHYPDIAQGLYLRVVQGTRAYACQNEAITGVLSLYHNIFREQNSQGGPKFGGGPK